MSAGHKAELHPDENVKLGSLAQSITKVAGGIGVVGLVATIGLGFAQGDDLQRFYNSYILAFTYFLSISLGALFFVVLQHLVKARWSVAVRRIAEVFMSTFPLMAGLALVIIVPLAIGKSTLFEWASEAAKHDHLLHKKAGYLNTTFFSIRVVIYFAVALLLSRFFFKNSVAQDETGDVAHTNRMRKVAPAAMILFAFVAAFLAFDLLMSLDPRWFSTIFGVYYFGGSTLAILCVLSLTGLYLQRKGILKTAITVEHYHDLGKLTFAFVFFWGYIAFSQFMLIWYANVPEETIWYQHRMFTSWKYVSLALVFGHFMFPFLFLLSRNTKRRLKFLAFFSIWLLVMHFVDLYWLVMPNYDKTGINFNAMDITAMLGIGGLFVAAAAHAARKINLIPVKDPDLGDSLQFENF